MSSQYKKGLLRYVFDPFQNVKIKRGEKAKALKLAREIVEDAVLGKLGDGESPVSGERWKKTLSKEYAARKSKTSSANFANMELFGSMLDSMRVRVFGNNRIAIEIKGEQAEKADGHNKLTGRKNSNPRRRFIPGTGQKLKKDILSEIREGTEELHGDRSKDET